MLSSNISALCTLLIAAFVAALPPPAASETARAPSLPALDEEALALHRFKEEKKNLDSGVTLGADQCNRDGYGCVYPYSLCCMAVRPPTCCPWYARYCSMDGKQCYW
ncbi:hypothetical protein L211DRAFT_846312 [Terfezia boudieri ATCC MYA-4762]|uniref:Granulins domain-containing protein n=1 Tax=Terfezia boudieri ATCC MYA-4762 TaxID=1051890 RepID=A0A3N4LXL0_9PEZI|nr:hypothetical protein L211DRAFT_846312 [Terfezia boudieri ATCC MYA-4762]